MTEVKQQSVLKIYDPEKEVKVAITGLQKQQKIINWAMIAVVVVVALGFIAVISTVFAIFIDHEDYAAQRYSEYIKLIENYTPRT